MIKRSINQLAPSVSDLLLQTIERIGNNLYGSLTLDRTVSGAGFLHLKTKISMKKNNTRDPGDPQYMPIC